MEQAESFLDEDKQLSYLQRVLRNTLIELKAELERQRLRADPAYSVVNSKKELRYKNMCDPTKTKLGERNVDYEEAQKIYKDEIVQRLEKLTNFQSLFDKEIVAFNKRWKRFQRNIINMQVGSVDVDWLNSIVTPETVQSKYARETGIEEKMIGRFSRVNYE